MKKIKLRNNKGTTLYSINLPLNYGIKPLNLGSNLFSSASIRQFSNCPKLQMESGENDENRNIVEERVEEALDLVDQIGNANEISERQNLTTVQTNLLKSKISETKEQITPLVDELFLLNPNSDSSVARSHELLEQIREVADESFKKYWEIIPDAKDSENFINRATGNSPDSQASVAPLSPISPISPLPENTEEISDSSSEEETDSNSNFEAETGNGSDLDPDSPVSGPAPVSGASSGKKRKRDDDEVSQETSKPKRVHDETDNDDELYAAPSPKPRASGTDNGDNNSTGPAPASASASGSLLEDYADTSTELPDYIGGDD